MVLTRKIAQELFEPFNLKLIQLRTKTSHGLNKLRQLKITIIIHWRRQRRRFGLPILLNYEAKKKSHFRAHSQSESVIHLLCKFTLISLNWLYLIDLFIYVFYHLTSHSTGTKCIFLQSWMGERGCFTISTPWPSSKQQRHVIYWGQFIHLWTSLL